MKLESRFSIYLLGAGALVCHGLGVVVREDNIKDIGSALYCVGSGDKFRWSELAVKSNMQDKQCVYNLKL